MKLFVPALALLPWLMLGLTRAPERGVVVFIGGDLNGYLSPCGCTKPMMGGVRRWATAVRREGIPGRTVLLHNGGLVAGNGRQDELKLGAAAEVLGSVGVAALNLSLSEAQLGAGALELANRLTSGALVASQIQPTSGVEWQPSMQAGPFTVYGASVTPGAIALQLQTRTRDFEIKGAEPSILLLRGDREAAADWARRFPGLVMVIYSSSSISKSLEDRVGRTLLVSPGENGKELLKLWWQGGEFKALRTLSLGPDVPDDRAASTAFETYLARVKNERLIDMLPRLDTEKYIGSKACASCHAETYDSWSKTRHAGALKTLELDSGQDQNPECISCHVVGITSNSGFKSRKITPHLTDVGCESCHGPGEMHQMRPADHSMRAMGTQSCAPCHKLEHSPNFRYSEFWQKIAH